MSALAIVKAFDVIKDLAAGLRPGDEVAPVNQFGFERAPEAIHGGVVVSVAFAARGADQASLGQRVTVIGTGVLDAAIGVEEDCGGRLVDRLALRAVVPRPAACSARLARAECSQREHFYRLGLPAIPQAQAAPAFHAGLLS